MSTATLTNSHLSFSWAPAISDCPTADIRYYILSANCGTCPIATADTSITCYDIPSCGLCILAVQTVVGDYTVKNLLSDPAYVSLNRMRSCIQIGNNSEYDSDFGKRLAIVKCIPLKFSSLLATIKIIMITLARMGRR